MATKKNVQGKGFYTVETEGSGKDLVAVIRVKLGQAFKHSAKGGKDYLVHANIRGSFSTPEMDKIGKQTNINCFVHAAVPSGTTTSDDVETLL